MTFLSLNFYLYIAYVTQVYFRMSFYFPITFRYVLFGFTFFSLSSLIFSDIILSFKFSILYIPNKIYLVTLFLCSIIKTHTKNFAPMSSFHMIFVSFHPQLTNISLLTVTLQLYSIVSSNFTCIHKLY